MIVISVDRASAAAAVDDDDDGGTDNNKKKKDNLFTSIQVQSSFFNLTKLMRRSIIFDIKSTLYTTIRKKQNWHATFAQHLSMSAI